MVIDYRGNIVSIARYQDEASVLGEINIRALRQYRATSPHAGELAQMRSGLWKQIYERWPDYPKNLYVDRTYRHVLERHALHLEALEKLFEAGVFTRPARSQ